MLSTFLAEEEFIPKLASKPISFGLRITLLAFNDARREFTYSLLSAKKMPMKTNR